MKINFIILTFCFIFNTTLLSWNPPTDDIGRPGDRGDAALISERSDSKDSDLS